MTREEIGASATWALIIWSFGFANVLAMFPQLVKILRTKSAENVSITMFILFMFIQIAFALDGYFKHNPVLSVCMTISAFLSLSTIAAIVYYDKRKKDPFPLRVH